jgi:hypothetical protein
VVIRGLGGFCVDCVRERDSALERAVLDLHVNDPLVPAAATDAADDECVARGRDFDVLGVDSGELDDDGEGGRILGAIDVDGRAEPSSGRHEARNLAEAREQLFHLVLQPIDVLAWTHARIVPVGRIVKTAGAAVGFLLYVWFAAVKNVDAVNERKRLRKGFDDGRSLH